MANQKSGTVPGAEKFFESLEAIAHKSSIYGKVILAKNIDNMTSNFERN